MLLPTSMLFMAHRAGITSVIIISPINFGVIVTFGNFVSSIPPYGHPKFCLHFIFISPGVISGSVAGVTDVFVTVAVRVDSRMIFIELFFVS